MNSNLHGHYYIKTPVGSWNGVIWNSWKGSKYSLKATSMMIRRLQKYLMVTILKSKNSNKYDAFDYQSSGLDIPTWWTVSLKFIRNNEDTKIILPSVICSLE